MRRLARLLRSQATFDRLAIVVLAVGAVVLVASLAGGSEDDAGGDEAVRLVPPNALVYVHATVEPNSDQWRHAADITRKLPTLRELRGRALRSFSRGGRPLDFDASVRPWIGDEAALALLPARRRATSLILVRVADQARARNFLRGAGQPREERHRGVTVRTYGGLAAAFAGNFLAIGSPHHVRAAIDAREGRSLRDEPEFRATVDGLETEDPIAYAYAPQAGVNTLLRRQGGEQRGARAALDQDLARPVHDIAARVVPRGGARRRRGAELQQEREKRGQPAEHGRLFRFGNTSMPLFLGCRALQRPGRPSF